MMIDRSADEFDDDDPDWNDDGEGSDFDIDDAAPTIVCPYCQQEIYEDSECCPHCERYLSEHDLRPKKSWLIVTGAAVCLYIVYRWIVA
jgi:hypothetical protein